jgi:hypothetical protein
MNLHLKTVAAVVLLSSFLTAPSLKTNKKHKDADRVIKKVTPKIQAAILLDVSNSMDGLIDQAKAQLWNMVNVMGKAKCEDATPQIEIALYEYGSPRNDAKQGYVKRISDFSTDLDLLSKDLFALTTNGGDEYCGHVIYSSINELAWDTSSKSYKVIFISGNEDFLQGDITYSKACAEAAKKGIIVNTIYCGDKQQGIKEHWNLSAECGNGSFTNIDQDAKMEDIPTPYDSALMVLNTRLNGTYLGYGSKGLMGYSQLYEVDQLNDGNKSVAIQRATAKANANVYRNGGWDLIDATTDDSSFVAKVDLKTLPDSLKNKSREEVLKIVKAKKEERSGIQKEILALDLQREKFLSAEKQKRSAANKVQTLQTETEKIIRAQAKRFNMVIE